MIFLYKLIRELFCSFDLFADLWIYIIKNTPEGLSDIS